MAKMFDTLWKYFKRGLVYEILAFVLGLIGGIAWVFIASTGTVGIIIWGPIVIIVGFTAIGWLVSYVVKKIN